MNSTDGNIETKMLLSNLKPNACSIAVPKIGCGSRSMPMELIRVQLYDESNYMLEQANVDFKLSNELKCIGSGRNEHRTGTVEYCGTNTCRKDAPTHCRHVPN